MQRDSQQQFAGSERVLIARRRGEGAKPPRDIKSSVIAAVIESRVAQAPKRLQPVVRIVDLFGDIERLRKRRPDFGTRRNSRNQRQARARHTTPLSRRGPTFGSVAAAANARSIRWRYGIAIDKCINTGAAAMVRSIPSRGSPVGTECPVDGPFDVRDRGFIRKESKLPFGVTLPVRFCKLQNSETILGVQICYLVEFPALP